MAHKCICCICGERFDRDIEQAVRSREHKNRYNHLKCDPDNPDLIPMTVPKKKELTPRRIFTDTLQKIFGDKADYPSATKLAEKYIAEYDFTYEGIAATLEWYYIICKHNTVQAKGSIGIVPYVYNQAKDYYKKIEDIHKINSNKQKIEDKVINIEIKEKTYKKPIKSFWGDDDDE